METWSSEGGPAVQASAEAVEVWTELANVARDELVRTGIPTVVHAHGESWAEASPGAVLEVNAGPPYGVVVRWMPAVAEPDDAAEQYLTAAKDLLEETMYSVLSAANFQTLIEKVGSDSYIFRVLKRPYLILE
ncbi:MULTISPECIES: hypothetical protein [Amycolatopsis]|nr:MULTISPECIES: hypothetical protein [Amycolatopsis]MYW97107.1 hypothetical protein [Amycolatopsis rubida]